MSRVLAIDPGITKCGVVVADTIEKKIYEAEVIKSHLLLKYVKKKISDRKKISITYWKWN